MTGLSNVSRLSLVLLLAGVVFCASALPAFADDGAGAGEARPADEKALEGRNLKAQDLEKRILDHPAARWSLFIGRFLPILIGIALLIVWFLKWDKIKGGVLPRPERAVPTLAFGFGEGLLWAVGGLAVAPFLVLMFLADVRDGPAVPTWQTVLAMAVGTGAVAVLLLLRRQRIQLSTPDVIAQKLGPDAPIPTKPPGLGRAFGFGVWTYCVAGVLVIPATLGWALLLTSLGAEPVTQGPVQDVVDGPTDGGALLMVVFGIFVAPFTEECIFRGMLYPGLKHALGGGKRAMWIAAIVISAIFAAVHYNLFAVIPLFVLALVLTWIFETTNSLAAVIFAHAIHNGVTMVPLLILRYAS